MAAIYAERGQADDSRRCCGEPAVSDAAEFFQRFPQEAAIVLQRGVELSAVFSIALVAHCAALAWQAAGSLDSECDDMDILLRWLCFARVACMAPRPYWWLIRRAHFVEARGSPTPQQMTQRLLEIQACPRSAVEDILRAFYYAWLLLATAVVQLAYSSELTEQVWHHLILNFVSMVTHRLTCMALFYHLTYSDIKRGVSPVMLNTQTTCLEFARDSQCLDQLGEFGKEAECSICLLPYTVGDKIRKLGCGHCFHCHCLDPWLLSHRNRCPLCSDVVGLPQ